MLLFCCVCWRCSLCVAAVCFGTVVCFVCLVCLLRLVVGYCRWVDCLRLVRLVMGLIGGFGWLTRGGVFWLCDGCLEFAGCVACWLICFSVWGVWFLVVWLGCVDLCYCVIVFAGFMVFDAGLMLRLC